MTAASTPLDADAARLAELGYPQELSRRLRVFGNASMGFAAISPVVGLYAVVLVGLIVAGAAWVWVLPVALAGALAMGAAFSLLYPSLSLIVVSRVSDTRRGAALGTFTAFFDAGVGLGAPLAGLAAALLSYEGAFLLSAAIALVSATTIALVIAPRGRALLATR